MKYPTPGQIIDAIRMEIRSHWEGWELETIAPFGEVNITDVQTTFIQRNVRVRHTWHIVRGGGKAPWVAAIHRAWGAWFDVDRWDTPSEPYHPAVLKLIFKYQHADVGFYDDEESVVGYLASVAGIPIAFAPLEPGGPMDNLSWQGTVITDHTWLNNNIEYTRTS